MKQKIAVLTSGGDAPGMNAVIRAVTMSGIAKGYEVYGVMGAYEGLLKQADAYEKWVAEGSVGEIPNTFVHLNEQAVATIEPLGSTMLLSARSKEFVKMENVRRCVAAMKAMNFAGLVVCGGDGSYKGARDLCDCGMPAIGIPGTIDNDIGSTEYAIGYDTAINTSMHMIDNLRDTMRSHSRCNLVEVMGRTVGHIALQVSAACGAISCVTAETEEQFDMERDLFEKIRKAKADGINDFIVIISEGFLRPFSHYKPEEHNGMTEMQWRSGIIAELAKEIEAKTGVETRATILGHVVRGGSPTVRDRVLATRFGYRAVELLSQGIGKRVIGVFNDEIKDFDITEGLAMKRPFNYDLYREIMEVNK